jgi:transitional endoplasmic reticulum ATPase
MNNPDQNSFDENDNKRIKISDKILKMDNPYYLWQRLTIKYKPDTILKKLDRIIQSKGGMFEKDPTYSEFRSLALQYKITLLIEWKRYAEALAWLCLESEINPMNIEALAIKEHLKRYLGFSNYGNIEQTIKLLKELISEWGPVVGMRRVKAIIEKNVLFPIREKDLSNKHNLTIPKGILLYGPPGCGKTFIVKQLAKIIKYNFIEVSPSTIASTFVHGTHGKIKSLFKKAEDLKPCLLFIDELEAFVPNRGRSDLSFHYQSEVNEFLIQLNNAYDNGILVVGATNHLSLIDDAVKRPGRFDLKIFIDPPDLEARISAFRNYFKNRKHCISKWDFVGEETEYYTFAEINYIVEQTAREATIQQKAFIDLNDLMKVIVANPPELNERKIRSYLS